MWYSRRIWSSRRRLKSLQLTSWLSKGVASSIVEKQASHGDDAGPVFKSESGGELMTLPGGALLALDPEWDETQVEDFFAQNGISSDKVSELDFIPNGFVIETGSWFPIA